MKAISGKAFCKLLHLQDWQLQHIPKYTNADEQMACQCCQNEMPFKVNEVYYFEAVQCFKGN